MCVASEVEETPNRPAKVGNQVELCQYKHAPGLCEAGNPNCIVCCEIGSALELSDLPKEFCQKFGCDKTTTVIFMQDSYRGINARDGFIIEGKLIPLEVLMDFLPQGFKAEILTVVPTLSDPRVLAEAFKRAINHPVARRKKGGVQSLTKTSHAA